MNAEQFNKFWKSTYPDTVPIQYLFKHDYHDRWFRIHSLPKSKRYAENEDEWELLLERQNQIITELFGNHSKILLVTGEYNQKSSTDPHLAQTSPYFRSYSFIIVEDINLYQIDPEEHTPECVYRPAVAEIIWTSGLHNELLRNIANDVIRVFFISIDKNIVIAPYDGGIDFILKDTQTRDQYKSIYSEWLSPREDGL